MEDISFFWIFLIIITCGFGAILYLLITHDSDTEIERKPKGNKKKVVEVKQVDVTKGLTDRQKAIFQYLGEKKMAKPPELRKVAGNVSSRTVRRDMNILVEKGLVSQEGSTKSTYYKYIAQ